MSEQREKRDLVIAGAGGFGRELAAYARDAGFEVSGFLDDDERADDSPGVTLRGAIGEYERHDRELVAIGVGHAATRLRIAETLTLRGACLATIVHPSAWVAPSASVGAGVAIAPFASVGPGATVGDLSLLNTYASLGHDAALGRGCVLASYAVATGHSVLEEEVFLASHAVVTPSTRIGAGARVSAGAVVFRDVPPGWLAAGNPARARAVPEARESAG
jgi:sugar O-acyltransferase (sialic acid O-acetyltransferase NeuD family)